MSRQIQIRRGSESEHASFTGAIGEVTMDTTNKTLRVHDGKTRGGKPLLSRDGFFSYTANCITKISQDINLELKDGTLTLTAGSRIYLAAGTIGASYILDTDITRTFAYDGMFMVVLTSENSLYLADINNCFSGPISKRPTQFSDGLNVGLYFATDENKMYYTGNGGANWYSSAKISLPIAIVTVSDGAISNIDQIFNGFGYVGSTVFVLPGVAGVAPDGFNPDGTCKNIEYMYSKVVLYTRTTGGGSYVGFCNGDNLMNNGYTDFVVSEQQPSGTYKFWYKPSENTVYTIAASGSAPTKYRGFVLWYEERDTLSPYKITKFCPRGVCRIASYSDTDALVNISMPGDKYISLGAANGGTYIAPKNGYFCINGISTSSGGYIVLSDNIMGQSVYAPSVNQTIKLFMPISMGRQVQLSFSGVTINSFCFRYASGTK